MKTVFIKLHGRSENDSTERITLYIANSVLENCDKYKKVLVCGYALGSWGWGLRSKKYTDCSYIETNIYNVEGKSAIPKAKEIIKSACASIVEAQNYKTYEERIVSL